MTVTRRRRNYPHGMAIDPDQIKCDIVPHDNNTNANKDASSSSGGGGGPQTSDMFVTMCFFARLGFVQPPACLKCAYKSSQCGETNNNNNKGDNNNNNNSQQDSSSKVVVAVVSCRELVPWRRDASIPLHPDKLDGNIVFVTCDTAKSLVNGDAYPSIRWDSRNRRLLHEM